MSVFRRNKREETPQDPPVQKAAPAGIPVSRDPDLAVPPFRPAAPTPTAPPSSPRDPGSMTLPPRPSAPSMPGAPGLRPAAPPARPQSMDLSDKRTLVVGKGISLQGTVSDAERLVVEGTVESQMIHAQELQIAHAGVFKGEVQVEDAEVAGLFDGSMTVRGNLIIRSTGRVLGTVRCGRLSVEEGGQLSGRMEMLSDGPAPDRNIDRGADGRGEAHRGDTLTAAYTPPAFQANSPAEA